MKRSIRILTPLVAVLLGVALMPADTFAQNPDFTGNWTLNTEASDLGDGGAAAGGGGGRGMGGMTARSMLVKHEGNTVTITTTRQGRDGQSREMVQEIIADGEPHTSETGRATATTTAVWKEDKLNVTTVRSFDMQGQTREFTTNQVFALTDGKLVVVTTSEGMGGGGSRVITAVYDKKD